MNFFKLFAKWASDRLHVKATELKGTPGVSDHSLAADVVNTVITTVIDSAVQHAMEHPNKDFATLLRVPGAALADAPGIDDHHAVADTVNSLLMNSINDIIAQHSPTTDPAHPATMKEAVAAPPPAPAPAPTVVAAKAPDAK